MNHSIPTTVVVCEAIIDGTKLLAEFTDGSFATYGLWATPTKTAAEQLLRRIAWATRDFAVEVVGHYNTECRLTAREHHSTHMTARLGWDYQQRGYR